MLTLPEAVDVFAKGWQVQRGVVWPVEDLWQGPIRVLRDAPGKPGGARTEELLLTLSGDTTKLEAEIESWFQEYARYRAPRHFVCVISPQGQPLEPIKRAIKARGLRAMHTEPFFLCDLADWQAPAPDSRVVRLTTQAQADALHAARRNRKVVRPEDLESPSPQVRHFLASGPTGEVVGWVRSVQALPGHAWVADLFVHESWRRQGLGTALMNALLAADQAAGSRTSVLLSSTVGAMLYPALGYRRIGTLQMFCPRRTR